MKKTIYCLAATIFAIIFTGCGETGNGNENTQESGITISVDKAFILSDGTDCTTIKVEQFMPDGTKKDITAESDVYMNNGREPLTSMTFSTAEAGEYVFYAVHDVAITEEISVFAYEELPHAPADPQAANTTFNHRLLLVQHTGTGCMNCPRMMDSLKELSEDGAYNTAYTHVACHSYISEPEDPCRSDAADDFSLKYGTGNFPELTFNLTTESTGTLLSDIKKMIDDLRKESINVGIAASAIVTGGDLLVNVDVKVAETGNYRVGVWVLEDDIRGTQTGGNKSWHNIHENALRAMITNAGSKTSFAGETAEELKSAKTANMTYRIAPESSWNTANCEFMIYVTAPTAEGEYDIVNSVVCKVGESIEFDYK